MQLQPTGLGLDVLLSKEGRCLVLSIRSPEREIGIQRISMTRINSPSHNSGGRA